MLSRTGKRSPLTFCFVYEPAPGHSVIMSSLASPLVAKAKATPENVVPYGSWLAPEMAAVMGVGAMPREQVVVTNKIDANNELSFALAGAFDLSCGVALLKLLSNGTRRRWAASRRVSCLSTKARRTTGRTWRTSRRAHMLRRSLAHGSHVGRISNGSTSVDRWRASRHLAWRGTVRTLIREGAALTQRRALRVLRIVGRIARRAVARARVIHWKTGRRR